ncbi:DNA binding domain-containing protein, excisionase family [Ruegeria marina]|uniref:DNA binding domain-containing protein, excisionase family n=2 Tax=Ruegeria marina TaxID=639004 RepID=A0A1G7FCH2_9RHOB|nr:DNA binding domain-containing protein, excisionase family [Ruegeria marina]
MPPIKRTRITMPRNTPRKTNHTRQLLTVKEVAQLDNCSEKTVRRAIAAGLLDVIRVGPGGRLIRIDPSAHAAYRRAQLL